MICKWCGYIKEKHNEKDLACPQYAQPTRTMIDDYGFFLEKENEFKNWLLTSYKEK